MKISRKTDVLFRLPGLILTLLAAVGLAGAQFALAQPPKSGPGPQAKMMPIQIKPDPRVQERTYRFKETDVDMKYVLYVSSKVSKDKKNPLIVALHGMGGDGHFLVREKLVDLADEGGYIVVGPLGYNVSGWFGSPIIAFGNQPVDPPNLRDLSEKEVMAVLELIRKEFNIDNNRTYLMGHSMGGAGALFLGSKFPSNWAAVASIAPAAFLMLPERKDYLGKIHDAGIPVILTQGGKDTVVPPDTARQWADTMKELGMNYKYIELPEGDHGTVIGGGMPDIFKFFAEHPKTGAK